VQARLTARRERQEAETAAKAAYTPPTAETPVYNEGRWWLSVNRGRDSPTSVKCQVFEPIRRDPSRGFSEAGSGRVTLCYPNDFDIDTPLPSGEHTVVWSLGTRNGGVEEARTSFTVDNDTGSLSQLRDDLRGFRTRGRDLLSEASPHDFDAWDSRIRALYLELKGYFENSPHLGKVEAMTSRFFHTSLPPVETAQVELAHARGSEDVTRR
jgi:hypothetical protein